MDPETDILIGMMGEVGLDVTFGESLVETGGPRHWAVAFDPRTRETWTAWHEVQRSVVPLLAEIVGFDRSDRGSRRRSAAAGRRAAPGPDGRVDV